MLAFAERSIRFCVTHELNGRLRDVKGPGLEQEMRCPLLRDASPAVQNLMFLEGRAIHELGAFVGALRFSTWRRGAMGIRCWLLAGLVASDLDAAVAPFLKSRGYAVSGWPRGRNLGLRQGVQHAMVDLVHELKRQPWPQGLSDSAGASAASMRASSPR